MVIRDARIDEYGYIREQRVAAYEQYADVLPNSHWQALKKAISSEADAQMGGEWIVADVDGQVAGSVVLFPPETDAYEGYVDALEYPEVRMLAVSSQFRGQGIASALVSECIRRCQQQGFHSLGLHTGEFMTGALRLYERMGFERMPAYDFQPADDGITVKAYRLPL